MNVDSRLQCLWKPRLGSSTEPPGQQGEASKAPQQQAQGGGDRSKDVPPETVTVPPSTEGPQPPAPKKKTGRQGTECRDRWRLGVEILALLVGILGFIGLLLTLREARRATEAAIQSTKAARDTLTETKKSFRLDQRPWVGLDQIDIPDKPTAGSAFRIKVSLRNSGKSPALRSDGEGTLYPVVIMEGDERVPLVDMTFSPKCANPKLQWDQNPSGGLILPEAKGISLSLSTPILEEKVVEKIMNQQ